MSRRHAGLIAPALAVAALIPTAGAAAAPPNACRDAAHAPGAKIVASSTQAVVFLKGDGYRGCAFRTERVRALAHICCADERVKVGGVYAAYVYAGTAIGDETDKLGIYDLRTGSLRDVRKLDPSSEGGGREIETNSAVRRFAVSRRGGVAWTQPERHADGTLGPGIELRAVGERHPSERIVASGSVDPLSLRLSRDTPTLLTWTEAGVEHHTSLDIAPQPRRPRLISPANHREIAKRPKGLTFYVRARAHERRGRLGIEIATPEDGVAPDGSFYHPYEEESGRLVQYELRQTRPGSTLWKVFVPNIAFYRSGVSEFSWHAYRTLSADECRTLESGKRDCFQESVTWQFTYNVFR